MGTSDSNGTEPLTPEDELTTKLLIEAIAKECSSSSHEVLQCMNRAIADGSKLEAAVLSGGYTNFSYKVYVDEQPETCVFAKLCFDHALWNPDREAHFDLKRVENEYEIMTRISPRAPGCVVAPLACRDVVLGGRDAKLLITEWSDGVEMLSGQFVEGAVDPRLAPKIAETLAALHAIDDFDPDFNGSLKPCFDSIYDFMKVFAAAAANGADPKDRTEAYCKSLGEDVVLKIMDANIANYGRRDCLIHSDSHVFNILVEGKPSAEKLETFGPKGTMILCDWETAMAGPIGRDIGLVLSFPIGCMIAHAMNGHSEANESIELFVNSLIDTYCAKLTEAGKADEEMASILRNIVGWCGCFQYAGFYMLGLQNNFPVESDENKVCVKDALGILGMKFLHFAFYADGVDESTGVEDVRKMFDALRGEEMKRAHDVFNSKKKMMKPRKSSIIRSSSKRLSSSEVLFMASESLKRMSFSEEDSRSKSAAIAEEIANAEAM